MGNITLPQKGELYTMLLIQHGVKNTWINAYITSRKNVRAIMHSSGKHERLHSQTLI